MEGNKKIRILFIGDGVQPTGFSRVIHSIIENISADLFDIHHLAVNYTGDPHPFDHKIYPAALVGRPSHPLGFDKLDSILSYTKPDMIYILNDIWVVGEYLGRIKTHYEGKPLPNIVIYFPVDGEGYQSEWFNNFGIVNRAVVYTKFGKKVVKKANKSLDLTIIPHGVDTSTFYPLSNDKSEVRAEIFKGQSNLRLDDFIVFNSNRNQPRKRLDIAILGFAMFAKDKSNVAYYHHAGLKDVGWDIVKLIKNYSGRLGYDLAEKMIFSNLNASAQAVEDIVLNKYNNVANVGINTSTGEGWGLCSVESAVTGAAQIVPNHTACAELFADCGELIEPVLTIKDSGTLLDRHYVSPEGVADALQNLYDNPKYTTELVIKGFEKFTSKKYSWKTIGKTWEKLFLEVADE